MHQQENLGMVYELYLRRRNPETIDVLQVKAQSKELALAALERSEKKQQ